MLARVTSLTGSANRIDERVRLIRDQLMPSASKLPGFEGGAWLVDRDSRRFISVTYWAGARELSESEETVGRLREFALHEVGGNIEWVQHFEVVARV